MAEQHELRPRGLVASLVAAIVFVLCLLSGVQAYANFQYGEQWYTRYLFKEIEKVIGSFGIVFEESAKTIEDLRLAGPHLFDNPQKQILDGWKRPVQFEFNGKRLVATSYGRDGQPGGFGLDADLSSDNPISPDHRPTFRQMLFDLPTRSVLVISVIAAGITFLLTFLTIKTPKFNVTGVLAIAGWSVVLVIVSCYIGIVLVLAISSGH